MISDIGFLWYNLRYLTGSESKRRSYNNESNWFYRKIAYPLGFCWYCLSSIFEYNKKIQTKLTQILHDLIKTTILVWIIWWIAIKSFYWWIGMYWDSVSYILYIVCLHPRGDSVFYIMKPKGRSSEQSPYAHLIIEWNEFNVLAQCNKRICIFLFNFILNP